MVPDFRWYQSAVFAASGSRLAQKALSNKVYKWIYREKERERENQDKLGRIYERNLEDPKLMRQSLVVCYW